MGQNDIKQMKQALIKRGFAAYKIDRNSESDLRRMCNSELSISLFDNATHENIDTFHKQHKFNMIYTLRNGEKIKVTKVGTTTLKSGRKVETFVDIAGNQYFQYRAADNTLLKEEFFKKQEYMQQDEDFVFKDNSIHVENVFSRINKLLDEFKQPSQKDSDSLFLNLPDDTEKEYQIIAEEFNYALKNKQTMEQLLNKHLNDFNTISSAYSKKYNRELIDDIINTKNFDEQTKEGLLKKINNYNNNFAIKNSKIKNEFWEGDTYNVKFQGNNVFITNTSTKEKAIINMDKLFENMNLKNKVLMMRYFQSLSGEILFDISKECKKIDSMKEDSFTYLMNKLTGNIMTQAGAYYNSLTDKITSDADDSLIHELGHAIDCHYRYKMFNTTETSHNKEFDKAFELGLKRYENDNYQQNSHIKMVGKGEYCTTNKQEMFAECYTLLMKGDCSAADAILYYFPECLKEAKNILKETRKLPDNVRR